MNRIQISGQPNLVALVPDGKISDYSRVMRMLYSPHPDFLRKILKSVGIEVVNNNDSTRVE